MASMTFRGLDSVIEEITRCSDRVDEVVTQMLKAGGEEMVKAWKDAIEGADLVKTGSMRDNVKAGKLKKDADGGSIVIYPRGTDENGTSNATKAFVNHYGTSRIQATGFVDTAEQNGDEPTYAAMRMVWQQMQK